MARNQEDYPDTPFSEVGNNRAISQTTPEHEVQWLNFEEDENGKQRYDPTPVQESLTELQAVSIDTPQESNTTYYVAFAAGAAALAAYMWNMK